MQLCDHILRMYIDILLCADDDTDLHHVQGPRISRPIELTSNLESDDDGCNERSQRKRHHGHSWVLNLFSYFIAVTAVL